MSSDATAADEPSSLDDRVLATLGTELPDGFARGATVKSADPDAGRVVLAFGCGCSGGLVPDERAVVRTTLVERLDAVDAVLFRSGCGCGDGGDHDQRPRGGRGRSTANDAPEAPF